MEKIKLNTFLASTGDWKFGDYLLFQEYEQREHDGYEYHYNISKPILAIYLGCFPADQTLGFNYVRWNNDNHIIHITNKWVKNIPTCKQVRGIESHIEWNDYIDLLAHWDYRPTWKEIIASYRNQNRQTKIKSHEIQWYNSSTPKSTE